MSFYYIVALVLLFCCLQVGEGIVFTSPGQIGGENAHRRWRVDVEEFDELISMRTECRNFQQEQRLQWYDKKHYKHYCAHDSAHSNTNENLMARLLAQHHRQEHEQDDRLQSLAFSQAARR